jgi:hypothetical protein
MSGAPLLVLSAHVGGHFSVAILACRRVAGGHFGLPL